MEPRLTSLMGDSFLERTNIDPRLFLPPPIAPRRPHPVEPSTTIQPRPSTKRAKASAPIAEVLNDVVQQSSPPAAAAQTSSLPPFSGRLSDLLLDPLQQHGHKRRRVEEDDAPHTNFNSHEHTRMTLPQPQRQAKVTPKRPRIPPLLQGLHQPPPVPSSAFPPITQQKASYAPQQVVRETLKVSAVPQRVEGTVDVPELAKPKAREERLSRFPVDAAVSPDATNSQLKISKAESSQPARDKSTDEQPKPSRKRNKWSEQETKDLLLGVSKFGIGSWKKILHCSDFSFSHRTAVDLKDRFRICRPGEGLKARQARRTVDDQSVPSCSEKAEASQTSSSQMSSRTVLTPTSSFSSISIKSKECMNYTDLAQMGIHKPFKKVERRARRDFTTTDDENLLKGFKKYHGSWRAMRNDEALGFAQRHPRDLRDRFRIRFPKEFAQAGFKLKAKEQKALAAKSFQSPESVAAVTRRSNLDAAQQEARKVSSVETSMTSANSSSPSQTPRQSQSASRAPIESFAPSDDFLDDFLVEASDTIAHSPVTLSRNIFEWADANPSSSSLALQAATASTVPSLLLDLPSNILQAHDPIAPDPFLDLWSNTNSTTPSAALATANSQISPLKSPLATSFATIRLPNGRSTKPKLTPREKVTPRSPYLPGIVYPHVPVASARETLHNLPRPADLLIAHDSADRPDTQSLEFILGEG